MTDVRDFFDAAIAATTRISAKMHYFGLLREAEKIDSRTCGNCEFWMQSRDCPRETNVNGRNVGPSASEIACNKFEIKPYVVQLKIQRLAEATQYAVENDLIAREET